MARSTLEYFQKTLNDLNYHYKYAFMKKVTVINEFVKADMFEFTVSSTTKDVPTSASRKSIFDGK